MSPSQTRPTLALSSAQIGIILALEPLLADTGMSLVCPACVRDRGDASLQTANSPGDETWKIDCQCRQRRVARTAVGTIPPLTGDLFLLGTDALAAVGLALRCPRRRCVRQALEMRQTPQGLVVRCDCARLTFRKQAAQTPTVAL